MHVPYLGSDLHKQIVIIRQGDVNTDWVLDNSVESH